MIPQGILVLNSDFQIFSLYSFLSKDPIKDMTPCLFCSSVSSVAFMRTAPDQAPPLGREDEREPWKTFYPISSVLWVLSVSMAMTNLNNVWCGNIKYKRCNPSYGKQSVNLLFPSIRSTELKNRITTLREVLMKIQSKILVHKLKYKIILYLDTRSIKMKLLYHLYNSS